MKIIVTGCAGFIGSNLTEYLLGKGFEVIGVDNFNPYYSPEIKEFNIASFKEDQKFTLYKVDIVDKSALEKIFEQQKNVKAIVHLAAWAGVTYSVKAPQNYLLSNVLGTNNLAELAVKYGVRNFVFASSSSIYGDNRVPFKEDMDTSKPNAPYPATKKAGEVLLYSYHKNFDLEVTIFRFFNPLGPKLRPDMALPKLVRAAEYGREFSLYQDPSSSSRDYTYIYHMLEAMELVLNKSFKYEIMNLGSSNPVSLVNLLTIVEKVTGKKIKITTSLRGGQVKATYADIEKTQKLIHYRPTTSLESMVRIYYDWFVKQPDWYKQFKNEI